MIDINWYNLRDSIIVTIWFVYLLVPMIWMCIYEYRYYKDAGEDYILYGKEYVKKKFIKISNGKKGN